MSHNISSNHQQLRSLAAHQQALVATTLVERMLPNYLLFCEVTEFGDGKVLRDALNIVWEKQIVKNLKFNAEIQWEKIEPNVPDVEDFDMFGVYPALDTAMALGALLTGIAGDDEDAFIDVCKLSEASVGKVVEQELAADNDEITAEMVEQHELMQYEAEFVAELIKTVSKIPKPDKQAVKSFRQRALADGITNIGIEV
ncbi:MAG: YjaG family protein [Psychrosphaera sp.]|nr:YjaG family protein [Psychrosphaera sp.]